MLINGVINGLIIGGILSLPVMGVAVVYGLTGIPNFGIGVIGVFGGFLTWLLIPTTNLALAALVGIAFCFPVGFFLQKFLMTPASIRAKGDTFIYVIITISFGFIMEGLTRLCFPKSIVGIDLPRLGSFRIAGVQAEGFKFIALLFGICTLLAIRFLEKYTRGGKSWKATSQNLKLASLFGINTKRVFNIAHGIGCSLACIGAIFWGGLYNLGVTSGWELGFLGFIIAVVGGIGNIWGGMISAVIMGMVMSFSGYFLGGNWQSVTLYGVVILVLILAPKGIMGSERSF
ncbi:MAG: branched-chain amino acid ABC transporter permease [Spirochaetes bacterium]|nr:branched-chain amino acid ABC transporter permease [Spirochaetota bacterium]